MEDIEKIKERIAKLLAMSKDSSSPEEAAIAAGRARRLMDRHQLDELDIAESIVEDFAERAATRAFANVPSHLSKLSVAVAKYNDVQAVYEAGYVNYRTENRPEARTKTYGRKIVFRGYKSDVELALMMFEYLVGVMSANCKAYLAGKGYRKYPVGVGSKYKDGWGNTVAGRLEAMTVERRQLEGSAAMAGTSLVLLKEAGVNAKFGEADYKYTPLPAVKDVEAMDARLQGMEDGRKVEIVKSVEE